MARKCTALFVSDEKQCQDPATSLNGLFCTFHSRQCQGLYRGYKRRNARLDSIRSTLPTYLAGNSIPLANQNFADVEDETTLRELHDHLFLRYQLLGRVIRARQLHHSRFYASNLDYGHQHFLDGLQNEKYIVLRALERLERHTAEVLYKKQQWFKWVRSLEDEEEAHRDNEKKKIKKEAALFQRHWKEVTARMKKLRAREDAKRQAEYLEKAYHERISQQEVDEDDEDGEALWDPIEDVIDNQRGSYVELIRHFLWDVQEQQQATEAKGSTDGPSSLSQPHGNAVGGSQVGLMPPPTVFSAQEGQEGQSLTDAEPNSKPKQVLQDNTSKTLPAKKSKNSKGKNKQSNSTDTTEGTPGKMKLETKSEVRQRLSEGMEYEHGAGWVLRGTVENPTETMWKTVPVPEDEIEELLVDIAEIKQLLFCRLLLAHAGLLPAALRASTVEEFLQDPEVTETDLRDLCLKMEQPGLQELRDACADLGRGDKELEIEDEEKDEQLMLESRGRPLFPNRPPFLKLAGSVPKTWNSKREKKLRKHRELTMELESGASFVDFGSIDDEGQYRIKKIRVKVCGRYIYNYPSEKAMLRGGWLQFSVIAKGSSLFDAMSLCRNWDEFYELTILACFQYFPTSNWATWVGDRGRQQMLQLGFVPYFQNDQADKLTMRSQTGSRSHAMRRTHAVIETRSFVCAHIKRNDPTSRRLVQYLAMQTARLVLLVRDAKTGSILVKPPEKELWLVREKSGVGRAARNEWNVIKQVGTQFFEEMDQHRKWHFGFKEYYDLVVWDLNAGQHFSHLYNSIQEMLIKAHRFCSGADFYGLAAHVLKTITREEATSRVRDIRPGEVVESIWDQIQDPRAKFMFSSNNDGLRPGPPTYLLYSESDALEDAVLFPEESQKAENAMIQHQSTQAMHAFEHEGPSIEKFIFDLDTDEDVDAAAEDEHNHYGTGDHPDLSDDGSIETPDQPNGGLIKSRDAQILELITQGGADNLLDMMERMKAVSTPRKIRKGLGEVNDEFEMFMDREKAFIFKESWHKADLELGAEEKYAESGKMVKKMVHLESTGMLRTRSKTFTWIQIMNWLEVDADSHRRIYRDARQAYAMMAMFFPSLYDPEAASHFTDSPLVQQTARAKSLPVRRSYHSNKYRPREFWNEWDEILKNNSKHGFDLEKYPEEWNCATRPIIAQLYREGVICNSYSCTSSGQAIGGKENGRYDLYFDWRPSIADCTFPPGMEDPTQVEPLISRARVFASRYSKARFAVLRLWSAPHFYPLMLGWNNRDHTSFTDGLGRTWEWKFIPKDMPYSEWSIHQQGRMRIKPYAKQFGDRVVVRRDAFLVMGKNEEDLLRLAVAATFAIVTRPWRLEVDLWKSFVNVDMKFLEDLDKTWLE